MKKKYPKREIEARLRFFPRLIRHAVLRNIRGTKLVELDPPYRDPALHAAEPILQMSWVTSPEGMWYWSTVITAVTTTIEGKGDYIYPMPPLIERYLYSTTYTAVTSKGTTYENHQVASETPYREEIISRILKLHAMGDINIVLHKTLPIYERLKDLRQHPAAKYDESVIDSGWYIDGPYGRLFLVSRGFGQDTEDTLYLEVKPGKLKCLAITSSTMMPPSNGKKYISEKVFQKLLDKYLP